MPCCALAGQQRKGKVAAYLGVSRGVTREVDRPDTRGVPCAEARGVPCAVLPPASPSAVGSFSCSSCDMGSTCCFKSSASSLACPAVTADVACTVAAGHNSVQRRDSKRLPPLALMLLDNTLAERERQLPCAGACRLRLLLRYLQDDECAQQELPRTSGGPEPQPCCCCCCCSRGDR